MQTDMWADPEIITKEMDLTSDMVEGISRSWKKNTERAEAQGLFADPEEFAKLGADRLST